MIIGSMRYQQQIQIIQIGHLVRVFSVSFLCFVALFEGLYLVFDAVDAVFDRCPNGPRTSSHRKVKRLG